MHACRRALFALVFLAWALPAAAQPLVYEGGAMGMLALDDAGRMVLVDDFEGELFVTGMDLSGLLGRTVYATGVIAQDADGVSTIDVREVEVVDPEEGGLLLEPEATGAPLPES